MAALPPGKRPPREIRGRHKPESCSHMGSSKNLRKEEARASGGGPGRNVAVAQLTGAPEPLLPGPADADLQTRTWAQEFTYKVILEES